MTYYSSFLGYLCPPQAMMEKIKTKQKLDSCQLLVASLTEKAPSLPTENIPIIFLSPKCVLSGTELLMMSLSGVIRVHSPT